MFSGRAIVIVRKFHNQPRMTFVSVSPVSAFSLARASMSLRGRGSIGETSQETAVSPRRGACSSRVALLVLSRLIVRPMKSSIYTSTMPLASTGMSMMRSRPIPNGMSSGSTSFGGTWACAAVAKRVSGSQSSCCKIAFIKLHTDSEIAPHSEGHGAPPKDSLSIISARLSAGSWVQVCTAVDAFKWHCRKAALTSSLVARIRFFGYCFHAATVQLKIRLRARPK